MPTQSLSDNEVKLQSRFTQFGNAIRDLYFGLNEPITVCLTTLIAKEHCLVIGPPGEGKSSILQSIQDGVTGSKIWFKQFHPDTDVDEVYNIPTSESLQNGSMERNLAGTLADCDIGVIDEIFLGSGALHSSLYSTLEKRIFSNGSTVVNCPLHSILATSNEIDTDQPAFTSRFLLKTIIGQADDSDRRRLMVSANDNSSKEYISDADKISIKMLKAAHLSSRRLRLTDEQIDKILSIGTAVTVSGGEISTRQLKRSVNIIKAYSWLCGNRSLFVEDRHLEILSCVFWQNESDREFAAIAVGNALS